MKRSKSLEERAREMKAKVAAKAIQVPKHLMTEELKIKRLRVLRKRMGLSQVDMARLLKMSYNHYHKFEAGQCPVPLAYVELAQEKYRRFSNAERQERFRQRQEEQAGKPAPVPTAVDPAIRTRVVVLYAKGLTEPEIARELALRPEIVDLCLLNVQD